MTTRFHLNPIVSLLTILVIAAFAIPAAAQITVRTSVDGQTDNQGGSLFAPPDANSAVGPNHIISWGNNSLMILNKSGTVISSQNATTFFGFGTGGDGHVIYDEISQRFAFEVLAGTNVGFAVSDTSDPTGPWHKIAIYVPGLWDGFGGNGIGYNADAYVVHVNGFNNQFAVIAASNNTNLAYTLISAPGSVRIGRPASMTTATNSGGPFYFLEGNDDGANGTGGVGGNIEVVAVSNILSAPTYTDYQVPTGFGSVEVVNVSWRNNLLAVVGHNNGGVFWNLLSTSNTPALLQNGTIIPDNNAVADVVSIGVAPNGSLGVNYTAADSSNVTTMYVTGRLATDAPGMMRASQSIISCPTTDGRWGDYSSTVIDVNSSGVPQNTFWACNEYLTSAGMFNWSERIANFSLDTTTNFGFELPHLATGSFQYNPASVAWTFGGLPGNASGLIANGSGFGNPNAPEGVQGAFVQGIGAISQTLSGFNPETIYTITYSAAQRSGGSQHGGESWNVDIDNSPIKTNAPGSTSYTTFTATFTASANSHNLSFVGTDLATGDNTVFLDNVRITPALNPVAPAVAVSSPTNNAVYAALATVNLSAAVTTNGNRINGIQYFSDGAYVGLATNAPYNYALVNVGGGTHNVVARLNFNDGSFMDSAPVSFYVVNRNPNYGFEVPGIGSGNFAYNPSGASWIFSGQSGIAANGSGFGNPNAPEGTQAAILQSYGSFSQMLSGFVPGTNYTITYSAAQRPGNSQSWNVTIDNTVIQTNSPGGSSYATYSTSFVASAAAHTLSFVGTDLVGGDNTVFIDKVTINPPLPSLVPAPTLTRDTLPATATAVVSDGITFSATFNNVPAGNYQWQFVNGGVITDLPGATNSMLTLTNLQLTNTGLYRLEAINATNNLGVAYSTASPLIVSILPPAVTNVITAFATQTGLGVAVGSFTPTWTLVPGSLIAGLTPSSASGNFSQEWAGRNVNSLSTGGSLAIGTTPNGSTSVNYVTCGNGSGAGSNITYTLPASATGYSITNITTYGGWVNNGRDQQAYTVYYSTVAAPATFISLSAVNYNPANNNASAQSATRATLLSASGALATNVAALKFDFNNPAGENGYCGYAQIQVFGVPTPQPVNWAVGNGNWDTSTLNWKLLGGGSVVSYVENNLAAFDDSATGSSPITVTLTGNRSPSIVTNNSTKNYILAGNFSITGGGLIKDGSSTLLLDNGGTNTFTSVLIKNGTLQVGNGDTGGSLGTGSVTNSGTLAFNRTDTFVLSNLVSGSGSVVQNGSGTLALKVADVYAGNTTVNAGTLALVEPGSIGASALITVVGGATLDVTGRANQTLTLNNGQTLKGSGTVKGKLSAQNGSTINPGDTIGVLTVQSNVVLNGLLVMEVNRTNGPVSDKMASTLGTITGGGVLTATNLGPTLQAGNAFQLFNQPVSGFATVNLPSVGAGLGWANNLANNGTLAVVSTASPSLLTQLAGGSLTLTWPADHTGWRLQVQTNNLAVGLGTNWSNVAGSTTTNQMNIPVNSANGSVFYRLLYQ